MTLKRDFTHIAFITLETIGYGEIKPTRIMYDVNLSWNTTMDILTFLEKKGLILCRWTRAPLKGSRTYTLTNKGQIALYHYKSLRELVEDKPVVSD